MPLTERAIQWFGNPGSAPSKALSFAIRHPAVAGSLLGAGTGAGTGALTARLAGEDVGTGALVGGGLGALGGGLSLLGLRNALRAQAPQVRTLEDAVHDIASGKLDFTSYLKAPSRLEALKIGMKEGPDAGRAAFYARDKIAPAGSVLREHAEALAGPAARDVPYNQTTENVLAALRGHGVSSGKRTWPWTALGVLGSGAMAGIPLATGKRLPKVKGYADSVADAAKEQYADLVDNEGNGNRGRRTVKRKGA